MFNWRITKYNPLLRDNLGFFRGSEWTSYSDIGSIYNGIVCTYEEYCSVEERYISAIISAMTCLGIKGLYVQCLQKNPKTILQQRDLFLDTIYCKIHEGWYVKTDEIRYVVQLILREYLWGMLVSRMMYVHFGYDYYMYIGLSKMCKNTLKMIEGSGLFVEAFKSPYDDSGIRL